VRGCRGPSVSAPSYRASGSRTVEPSLRSVWLAHRSRQHAVRQLRTDLLSRGGLARRASTRLARQIPAVSTAPYTAPAARARGSSTRSRRTRGAPRRRGTMRPARTPRTPGAGTPRRRTSATRLAGGTASASTRCTRPAFARASAAAVGGTSGTSSARACHLARPRSRPGRARSGADAWSTSARAAIAWVSAAGAAGRSGCARGAIATERSATATTRAASSWAGR
jgi:hypothetical protein